MQSDGNDALYVVFLLKTFNSNLMMESFLADTFLLEVPRVRSRRFLSTGTSVPVEMMPKKELLMNNKGPSYHSGNSKGFGELCTRNWDKDPIYFYTSIFS